MKNLKTLALTLLMTTSLVVGAFADTRKFEFKSYTDAVTAVGYLSFNSQNEVTSITGSVENSVLGNQNITGIVLNNNFPGVSYSPDGLFYFNNLFYQTGQCLDINGILFTTNNNTGYWNLWGTGNNNYTLYASANGGFPVQEFGSLTTTVPEPSTWALMLLGFGSLGVIGYRKRQFATD